MSYHSTVPIADVAHTENRLFQGRRNAILALAWTSRPNQACIPSRGSAQCLPPASGAEALPALTALSNASGIRSGMSAKLSKLKPASMVAPLQSVKALSHSRTTEAAK